MRKKLFNVFVFAVSFIVAVMFISCNEEEISAKKESEDFADKIEGQQEGKTENVTNIPINLAGNYIQIWSDCSYTVKILQDGDFSVRSENPDVASVRMSDSGESGVCITAKDFGKSEISITDNNNPESKTVFTCYSTGFNRHWGQPVELLDFDIFPNEVIIAAENRTHAAEIEAELLNKAIQHRGDEYEFQEDGKLIIQEPFPNAQPIVGTFKWDRLTRKLTMDYKNATETYSVDILPPNSNSSAPPFIAVLIKDYTAEYAAKYPKDGITEVTLRRTIMSYGERWWRDPSDDTFQAPF